MDLPDMDQLLDSLEDSPKPADKVVIASTNLTSKSIDDSAREQTRQPNSVNGGVDRNYSKSVTGTDASVVEVSDQMKGLEDVLNELEDNKNMSINISEVPLTIEQNNVREKPSASAESEQRHSETSSEDGDNETKMLSESANINDSESSGFEHEKKAQALDVSGSQELKNSDSAIKGLPENIERIISTSLSDDIQKDEDQNIRLCDIGDSVLDESIKPNVTETFELGKISETSETIEKLFLEPNLASKSLNVPAPISVPEIRIDEVESATPGSLEEEHMEFKNYDTDEPQLNEEGEEKTEETNDENSEVKVVFHFDTSTVSNSEAGTEKVVAETEFEASSLDLSVPESRMDIVTDEVGEVICEEGPRPVAFDTTEEIPEALDEELMQELDQMAEQQIKEGTIEAAAVVAAELRDAEPQLEPAKSYISEAPFTIPHPNTVILSTHDLSVVNANPPLTESELQLGKTKPYWIPDEDCSNCMLCSTRFTVINRRHHCRCCGRVLCSSCCSIKRALPYIEDSDKKQRVCEPCSKTLVKIEDYENAQAEVQRRQLQRRQQNHENLRAANEAFDEAETAATTSVAFQRKKSVLKSKNSEKSEMDQKRTVKFLDGINPGHDLGLNQPGPSGIALPASAAGTSADTSTEDAKPSKKKVPKGTHRRNRERRVQEEQISLVREDHLFLVDYDAQMTKISIDKVLKKLVEGEKITVAIKRNYWVVIQLVNYRNTKVWFFASQGMASIGSDELVIAFESQDFDFEVIEEVIQFFSDERKRVEESKGNNSDSTETSDVSVTDNLSPPRSIFITAVLYLFDHFFLDALIPSDESLDEKVGIRRCGERVSQFYRVPQGEINGIETAAVIFHRPIGQNFENLPIPSYSPFLVGTFIQKSELSWAMTIPNRLLLKIGLQASHFPFPIVNERSRSPAYTECSENTVLKVFNDFKNWSYRLPKIVGSTVEIENGSSVSIRIPPWANEIKQMLESNRNMLAWATMLTDHSDCHLVAIQNPETTFRTEIFTDVESTRERIGCNFVVLDGSLKNSSESFVMSIVEDGVIIRFSCETLEEVIKCLLSGTPYSLNSSNMRVNITFDEPYEPKYKTGGLLSPIDQLYLIGKYQYGLNLSRQFRSQMLIPTASEWALRLSTVINIEDGKIPLQLQPRYFEICEQVGTHMASTIGCFVRQLTISDQRQICIRIKIESDSVSYDTAQWQGLEQEHYVWTAALDDQLIPYLYQLCQFVSTFHMELHFSLISIRLLSNVEY